MKTPPLDMLTAVKKVIAHAYAPYSHFSVAACVRTNDGTLFSGCNVENASFSLTLCAESNALGAAFSAGYQTITEALILVSDKKVCPPCGACRQRLLECANKNILVHLCTMHGDYTSYTLSELLPHAFGPKNLEEK